jgi:starvation-inducible DNA-binding protein
MKVSTPGKVARSAAPLTGQRAHELQAFGTVVAMPIALAEETRRASAENLNQLLADTITLRDLYKKHHWQVSGPTFYSLHLLFDKHFGEQSQLVDLIAERIMMLGGVSLAMAADVAETTLVPRPPRGREQVPVQLSHLLHAHEIVLEEARAMARKAAEGGDDGTKPRASCQLTGRPARAALEPGATSPGHPAPRRKKGTSHALSEAKRAGPLRRGGSHRHSPRSWWRV